MHLKHLNEHYAHQVSKEIIDFCKEKHTGILVLPEYVEAPVSKGQQLGTAAFYQGDIYLYEVPLTAASSVPRLTFSRAFLRLLDNMLK